MSSLGTHIIAELYGREFDKLDDLEFLRTTCTEAVENVGAQILNAFFHKVEPHGVRCVIAVVGGHLSVYTWPEHGYAAVDFFCCTNALANVKAILQAVDRALFVSGSPSEYYAMPRGQQGTPVDVTPSSPFPFS